MEWAFKKEEEKPHTPLLHREKEVVSRCKQTGIESLKYRLGILVLTSTENHFVYSVIGETISKRGHALFYMARKILSFTFLDLFLKLKNFEFSFLRTFKNSRKV